MKKILAILAALLMIPAALVAQIPGRPASLPADSLQISFVTCYPGPDVYELYGHTAIHISGTQCGLPVDLALNYGLFDFNADNFVYHFMKGDNDYIVGVDDWNHFLQHYLRDNRRVVEHHIPMDSVQTARFLQLMRENLQPENSHYRYKWAHNNCSTKALDLVQLALGDSIVLPQPDGDTAADKTFRQMLNRYHSNYPWYDFGIDLALGSTIDKPMTAREKSFAPIAIDLQLPGATVGGRPLTSGITVINEGADATLPPTPWYFTPTAVFWLLFLMVVVVTVADIRRRRVSKWLDTALYGFFGIVGCVVAFLVFISEQEGTSPNWLMLWLNPLCLIVPALIWLKKCKKVVFSYQICNFALLIAMSVLWPMSGQTGNPAFIPLICCDALRAFNYIFINKNLIFRPKQASTTK